MSARQKYVSYSDVTDQMLEGRVARCAYNCDGSEKPSSMDLPFFEYLGEGTQEAVEKCRNCGFYQVAHEDGKWNKRICDRFESVGDRGFDRYYCGCRGWD